MKYFLPSKSENRSFVEFRPTQRLSFAAVPSRHSFVHLLTLFPPSHLVTKAFYSSSSSSGSNHLTHLDESGRAKMVAVGEKAITHRVAVASARLVFSPNTADTLSTLLAKNRVVKGDAFTVAEVAGIQAAKRTSELIPLCHQVPLSRVAVQLRLEDGGVHVEARAEAEWRTGVEMEALTACAAAALAMYDMCKAVDKGMRITELRLEHKTGGRSGDFNRSSES